MICLDREGRGIVLRGGGELKCKTALSSLILCAAVLGFNLRGTKSEDVKSPCYAFLLNGDVYVSCNKKLIPVTMEGNVTNFAISHDASSMVLIRTEFFRHTKDVWIESDTMEVVALIGGRQSTVFTAPAFTGVTASCGTIILPMATSVRDVVNGSTLRFEPYNNFRCSSSRDKILGIIDSGRELRLGLPPTDVVVRMKNPSPIPRYYDMSPSGVYIAYAADWKLCVAENGDNSTCVDYSVIDRVSVSDSGDVIFATSTGEDCYYKDMWHVSKKALPGYTSQDACVAVGLWRFREPAPKVVRVLARAPQWITPEAADALSAWRTRRQVSPRRRHHNAANP